MPQTSEALRALGAFARQRGDRENALKRFQAAAAIDPQNFWIVQEIAWELHALQKYDEAEAAYRRVLVEKPEAVASIAGLGALARQRGDHEIALKHFQAAVAIDPLSSRIKLDLAGELRELGRLDEAEAAYGDVLQAAPRTSEALRALGAFARQRGDRENALKRFQAAAAIDPQNIWIVQETAWELHALQKFDEAEAAYRRVLAEKPEAVASIAGLGALARQRGDHENALKHFQAAAAIDSDNVWVAQDLATELREIGRAEEGEEVIKGFLESHPNSGRALIAYANFLRPREGRTEPLALLERAVATEPGPHSWLALANEYLSTSRIEEADALFDAVLSAEEDDPWAAIGKGQAARQRGRRDLAKQYFQRASRNPAAGPSALIELSREWLDEGRFDESDRILVEALAKNPSHQAYRMQLGYNARAAGRYAQAYAEFEQVVRQDPLNDQARVQLAIEHIHLGRADAAIELLHAVIARNPRQAQAYDALSDLAQQLDDIRASVELQKAAIAIDASNVWRHLKLAQRLLRQGHLAQARAVLATCRERFGPAPEIDVIEAEMLNDACHYTEARTLLAHAVARRPEHFELWRMKVASLIISGAFADARRAAEAPPPHSVLQGSQICILQAQIAAAEWNLDQAYEFFLRAREITPHAHWMEDFAARLALLRCDIEAAARHLDSSVRNSPWHRIHQQGSCKTSQTHIGQLLDEFRIDRDSLRQLRVCLAAERPVEAIAELVTSIPDHTSAAICFLIALRRGRRFQSPSPATPANARRIPARIAQFWDDDIPPDVAALCDGWRAAHPGFVYRRFSKAEARAFLAEKGGPDALAAFDRAGEPAMKADIFRLAWLFVEGGYYVDADDRCLAPVSTIDAGVGDLLVYQEDLGSVGNNFIGAVPGHPVIGTALRDAVAAINRGDSDMVWLSTGPGLLTRALASYLSRNLEERLSNLAMLERHELFEAVGVHSVAAYKYSPKHWSRTAFARMQVYAAKRIRLGLQLASEEDTWPQE